MSTAMAGKNHFSKPGFRFFPDTHNALLDPDAVPFELDESDVWNNSHETRHDYEKWRPSARRLSRKSSKTTGSGKATVPDVRSAASSLPVNIPDWSKILRGGDYGNSRAAEEEGEESDVEEIRLPPHEFLAKQFASLSVHEGIGRTLKGRDLSRVRNAIWEKTGFED